MNLQKLNSIINKYVQIDTDYFEFLSRLKMFCSDDYFPLIEQSETEGKRLYLKVDRQEEAFKEGIFTDGTIYLEDIGIR